MQGGGRKEERDVSLLPNDKIDVKKKFCIVIAAFNLRHVFLCQCALHV